MLHYNGRVINIEVKVTKWHPPTIWQTEDIKKAKSTNTTVVSLVPAVKR